MNDKFSRVILTGILICLIAIVGKIDEGNNFPDPTPSVTVDNIQQFIQIAPNRIGIIDTGIGTGYSGQLIVFDFEEESKTFKYVETLNAAYILDHPDEYGIPKRKQ